MRVKFEGYNLHHPTSLAQKYLYQTRSQSLCQLELSTFHPKFHNELLGRSNENTWVNPVVGETDVIFGAMYPKETPLESG